MSNVVDLPKRRIDFDRLQKDSWIEAPAIEAHTGVSRTDRDEYRLRVLSLRREIESRCEILCRQDGDRLRLMSDAEASLWNVRQLNAHAQGVLRAGDRTKLIDQSGMSTQQRAKADHAERYALAMANAVRDEKSRHRSNPVADLGDEEGLE